MSWKKIATAFSSGNEVSHVGGQIKLEEKAQGNKKLQI